MYTRVLSKTFLNHFKPMHYVKSVSNTSFFGTHFFLFGLNICIQSEYGKILTRKNTDYFYKHTTSFPRCFNVEYTWCVCRIRTLFTRSHSFQCFPVFRIKFKNSLKISWKALEYATKQKMKFFIEDFFSKCDQIWWKLEKIFIFCAV